MAQIYLINNPNIVEQMKTFGKSVYTFEAFCMLLGLTKTEATMFWAKVHLSPDDRIIDVLNFWCKANPSEQELVTRIIPWLTSLYSEPTPPSPETTTATIFPDMLTDVPTTTIPGTSSSVSTGGTINSTKARMDAKTVHELLKEFLFRPDVIEQFDDVTASDCEFTDFCNAFSIRPSIKISIQKGSDRCFNALTHWCKEPRTFGDLNNCLLYKWKHIALKSKLDAIREVS